MRESALERLKSADLDVLILGGGVNGAGVARDLALRAKRGACPLKVGLVERRQFGSGTSGRNSQLIHGGLRYLKHLDVKLVRESLHERAVLLKLAPGFVSPLGFIMPLSGSWERLFYGAGLTLYDALAGSRNIGRHQYFSRERLRNAQPALAADSAYRFYDARVHSARLVLANVLEALEFGVAAVNHVAAAGWERSGGQWNVELIDGLSGTRFAVRTRSLVDATGAWSTQGGLRLVRGSHIVVPRVTSGDDAIAWFEPSGRIVFVIPWGERSDLNLVGTTDVDHDTGPDRVRITDAELQYLVRTVKTLFPGADAEPVSAFSSLRPLLRDESGSPEATTREHRIRYSRDGILDIAGGKYTTYRLMSEEAVDKVLAELAPPLARMRVTATAPIRMAEPADRTVEGRITHAVECEMARSLADLLFVSTYWGYERRWTRESLAPYAAQMAGLLGWDRRRTEEEVERVLCELQFPGAQ